jgi:hypothetical protein
MSRGTPMIEQQRDRELLATPFESRFLLPALGHPENPMSENTVGKALRIMGYSQDDMSARGFRSLARSAQQRRRRA